MTPTLSRKSVHMTLCGKGGVGKSVIARLLTEYLTEKGEAPLAFDADPVNASFAAVRAFDVEKVSLIDADQQINPGFFDQLILRIVDSNRSVVLDTGAASYVPLFNYMRELDLAETLNENGFDLFFHVALAGGPALPFTVENLKEVCQNFGQDAGVMVWLNHYWAGRFRDQPDGISHLRCGLCCSSKREQIIQRSGRFPFGFQHPNALAPPQSSSNNVRGYGCDSRRGSSQRS